MYGGRLRPAFRWDASFSWAATLYFVWTVALMWAVLRQPGETIPMDVGDPVLNAAILHWNATTLPLSHDWWNFPSFSPADGVTAFTEHLLGLWPVSAPVVWLTGNPLLAYNVVFFLSFLLAGLAMFSLVRWLTGSAAGACVAGAAFAFNPYRGSQFPHIQVLMTFGMPLALLGLHRYMRDGRRRALLPFAVGWLCATLSNGYFLVFFGVYVVCWVVWFGTAAGMWRRVPLLLATWAVASAPLIAIGLSYMDVHARYGFARSLPEIRAFSADISGLFVTSDTVPLAARILPVMPSEGALFPGFALLVLAVSGTIRGMARRDWTEGPLDFALGRPRWLARIALAGVIAFGAATVTALLTDVRIEWLGVALSIGSPHKPLTGVFICSVAWIAASGRVRTACANRDPIVFYAAMAVLMWLFSLGPEARLGATQVLYAPPYSWLLELPGASGLRVPARFWMLGIMSLCVLVGYAFAGGTRRSRAGFVVALGVVLAEGWTVVVAAPFTTQTGPVPPIRDGPVIVLPLGESSEDAQAQFRAVTGGYRVMNGYSGYAPAHYAPLRIGLELRDAGILTELRRTTPVYVNVRADGADGWRTWFTAAIDGERLVAESSGRALYRLEQRPDEPKPVGRPLPFTVSSASCSPGALDLVKDDSLDSRWECGPAQPGQAIVVDVGAVRDVSGIGLALGPFSADSPRTLRIDASMDGGTWQEVWQGPTAAKAMRAAFEAPTRVEFAIPFPSTRARYLRLTQTGDPTGWYWSIAELRVFGTQ